MEHFGLVSADIWGIIESFFAENTFVKHQIESFNTFILHVLPSIIMDANPMDIQTSNGETLRIQFTKIKMSTPLVQESDNTNSILTPNLARLRGITYNAPVHIDAIKQIIDESGKVVYSETQNITLCKLPIMVNSGLCVLKIPSIRTNKDECVFDEGGYFIINGSEKVLMSQERMANNTVFVYRDSKHGLHSEIRSCVDSTNRTTSTIFIKLSNTKFDSYSVKVELPYIKEDIPAVIVFKALGLVSDKQILQAIELDEDMWHCIEQSISEAAHVRTQSDALEFIGKFGFITCANREKRISYANQIILRELFPHISTISNDTVTLMKVRLLGYMIKQLILTHLNVRDVDDRDSYINKRIDVSGILISQLFRQLFGRLVKDMKKQLKRKYTSAIGNTLSSINLTTFINENTITKGIQYSLSTGNWAVSRTASKTKAGVSQVLHRLTYTSAVSHLRRLNTPLGREGKVTKPRQVHNSQYGRVCLHETPEGQACGLVKNLALMAHITSVDSDVDLEQAVFDCGAIPLSETNSVKGVRIFVNGRWIGLTSNPSNTVNALRYVRTCGGIPYDTAIIFNIKTQCIKVTNDSGRMCRPLFVVNQLPLFLDSDFMDEWRQTNKSFDFLVKNGIIEYLDTEEESTMLVATTFDDLFSGYSTTYTHCEIHPSMVMGTCASTIPFCNHNQAPRITYQTSMGKQAMGIYATNWQNRYDTIAHILINPQKPLVGTKTMNMMHSKDIPAGQNCIVAIACYTGLNQEDSLLINQGSIDRGLFRSIIYKSYKDEEKRHNSAMVSEFERPTKKVCVGMRQTSYKNLDIDGIVIPQSRVKGGDALVGKTTPVSLVTDSLASKRQNALTKKDDSTFMKLNERGVVDSVMLATNQDGLRFTKIRIRDVRIPEIGDKFASLIAQKGTCGLICRQEDMPFTRDGITPDIIINPHCFTADTQVTTYCGTAKKINTMSHNTHVWSWDEQEKCFIPQIQYHLHTQNIQPILEITMMDGRTIKCTHDHKFLTLTNNDTRVYVEAQQLVPGVSNIIMGIEAPLDTESADEYNWTLYNTFNMNSYSERERALAFTRLLGITYTSGYITKKENNKYTGHIYLENIHDVNICRMDIYTLTNKIIKGTIGSPIRIPSSLANIMANIPTHNNWPRFIASDQCPVSIIREFVGVILGGNTWIHANMDTIGHISFTQTTDAVYTNQLIQKMTHIITLLNKVGVNDATISTQNIKNRIEVTINIDSCQTFAKKVGFRYATQKTYRLSVSSAYAGTTCEKTRKSLAKAYTQYVTHGIPMFTLPVLKIKYMKRRERVYCVTVDQTHNFVANGLTVQNCQISRMTVGQLLECITGKVAALSGTERDATPFDYTDPVHEIAKELKTHGYQQYGMEKMYSGHTGKPLEALIFIGPVYYQRLKHLVNDKQFSRSHGPVTALTRQPLEGRARQGGLRVGEMERDCMIAHGASMLLRERLFLSSDKFQVTVCDGCHTIISGKCKRCAPGTTLSEIKIPYVTKLLFYELNALNISTKLITE